ncbi:hypothetical protein FCV66_23145 [Enterovibrio norvegicus]|uniref:hypothetical protein n=1 Tax=Enterovibrio norvegicus TaxID=188144 RepID=UPI0010BE9298|nr:hypothetical protein [Enterovibrio norvegicus]TKF08126.1 hypothetical protein FCV66_23145 [Enterovibrio norvegicus]
MTTFTSKDKALWANHAIAYYASIGNNQKQLAYDLGIPESRLTELKSGKGSFSPTLRDNIIDLCGAPQRVPGRFEVAEIYTSLDTFFSGIAEEAETRYNQKAANWLEEQTEFILSNQVLFEDKFYKEPEPTTTDDIGHICFTIIDREKITQEQEDSAKLTHLNTLLNRSDVGLLFKQFEALEPVINTTGKGYDKKLNLIAKQLDGLTGYCKDHNLLRKLFICWYLMWRLRQANPSYHLGNAKEVDCFECLPQEEIILTGTRVLAFHSDKTYSHLSQIEGGPILFDSTDYLSQTLTREKAYFKGDIWPEIRFEVYHGENMTYHFLLHFSGMNSPVNDRPSSIPGLDHFGAETTAAPCPTDLPEHEKDLPIETGDRIAVIPNIPSTQLYNQIQQIRKAFGLPEDSLYTLKSAIAKAGGHIPGAKVLS